jgi:hypothetical protein
LSKGVIGLRRAVAASALALLCSAVATAQPISGAPVKPTGGGGLPPAPSGSDPGLAPAKGDPTGDLPIGPDCSVYPNAFICQLALQPPDSGKPCRGSDAFGITLNDQLPLGSTGKANDINNIYYLYEGATFSGPGLGGGQILVGWIAVTKTAGLSSRTGAMRISFTT